MRYKVANDRGRVHLQGLLLRRFKDQAAGAVFEFDGRFDGVEVLAGCAFVVAESEVRRYRYAAFIDDGLKDVFEILAQPGRRRPRGLGLTRCSSHRVPC
jgi:hypothetical protein